jgi:hypothetical protein
VPARVHPRPAAALMVWWHNFSCPAAAGLTPFWLWHCLQWCSPLSVVGANTGRHATATFRKPKRYITSRTYCTSHACAAACCLPPPACLMLLTGVSRSMALATYQQHLTSQQHARRHQQQQPRSTACMHTGSTAPSSSSSSWQVWPLPELCCSCSRSWMIWPLWRSSIMTAIFASGLCAWRLAPSRAVSGT